MTAPVRFGAAWLFFAVGGTVAFQGPNPAGKCQQRFDMRTYSACFPNTWHVDARPAAKRVSACNKLNGDCTGTGGGFPLPTVVFVFLFPADSAPGHPQYRDAREIAATAVQLETPVLSKIDLLPNGKGDSRQCWVSRSLMFGKVWNDVYGLQVGSMLFRASAQYNDEPARVEEYRRAVLEILSSVSVRE